MEYRRGRIPGLVDPMIVQQPPHFGVVAGYANESPSVQATGSAAGGRTFVFPTIGSEAETSATTAHVKFNAAIESGSCRLRHFRPLGANKYQVVEDVPFSVSNGVNTYTVSIDWDLKLGDCLGVWLPNTGGIAIGLAAESRISCRYISGGETATGTQDFSSGSSMSYRPTAWLEGRTGRILVGDSIFGGHTDWFTSLDTYAVTSNTVPGGDTGFNLAAILGGAAQNLSRGSQTWAWAASTGVPNALSHNPTAIVCGLGVNDLSQGRTWAQVENDLDTVLSACSLAAVRLEISEILPWSAGSDAQAATLRQWNINLGVWCAANGILLRSTHDVMGQTRPSTGYLDDLKSAYAKGDGTHLTEAGIAALSDRLW